MEGGRHGITCNAIVPGVIGTEAFNLANAAMNERIVNADGAEAARASRRTSRTRSPSSAPTSPGTSPASSSTSPAASSCSSSRRASRRYRGRLAIGPDGARPPRLRRAASTVRADSAALRLPHAPDASPGASRADGPAALSRCSRSSRRRSSSASSSPARRRPSPKGVTIDGVDVGGIMPRTRGRCSRSASARRRDRPVDLRRRRPALRDPARRARRRGRLAGRRRRRRSAGRRLRPVRGFRRLDVRSSAPTCSRRVSVRTPRSSQARRCAPAIDRAHARPRSSARA